MKNRLPFLKYAAIAAGLTLSYAPLEAAVLVSYSATQPTGSYMSNPFVTGTDTAGSFNWQWRTYNAGPPATGGRQDVGQAFISDSDFSLSSITLFTPGASTTTVPRPFELIIEEFAGSTATTARTTIATYTGNLNHLGSGSRYVTFTLDNPITLDADSFYGFRLSFTSEVDIDVSNRAAMAFRTTIGIEEGQFMYYINYPTSPNAIPSGQNLEFYLGGQAIPEGGTLALIGIGGVALVAARRRKLAR